MTRTLTIRLDDDRAAALDMVSRAAEQTLTDTMRIALDAHIEAKRNDKEFMDRLSELHRTEEALFKRLAG